MSSYPAPDVPPRVPPTVLPYLAAIRVEGEDAAAFLHAQLSADISALQDGDNRWACYCSPKGQVLALMWVQRRVDHFVVVLARDLRQAALERLRRFVLRARVRLEAIEDPVCGLDRGDSAAGFRYGLCADTGGATKGNESEDWLWAELEQGICWLGVGSSEQFIPQMLGFDRIGAVSFTKGCYPGQEIIARARYLGRVKRRPWLLRLKGLAGPETGRHCQVEGFTPTAGETDQTPGQPAVSVEADCIASVARGGQILCLVVAVLDDGTGIETLRQGGQSWPARAHKPASAGPDSR